MIFGEPSVQVLPHSSRVFLAHPCSLFCPLLPSTYYAGYIFGCLKFPPKFWNYVATPTMRDKSVDTLPSNGPFLHSGYTYPLPLSTPTPSPKINVEFWTLKSFFYFRQHCFGGSGDLRRLKGMK